MPIKIWKGDTRDTLPREYGSDTALGNWTALSSADSALPPINVARSETGQPADVSKILTNLFPASYRWYARLMT